MTPPPLAQVSTYLRSRGGEAAAAECLAITAGSPGLQDLTRNPFLLRLFVEALPALKAADPALARVTRHQVYQAFVGQWFQREVARMATERQVRTW